jgi:hypothetical protein
MNLIVIQSLEGTFQMDLSKNRAWIIDKDKSKEFIELFEAQKNSEKNKKFWENVKRINEMTRVDESVKE